MSLPFVCPVCRGGLAPAEKSLRCESGHAFDLARQGYVNLLRKKPENIYEDKALFLARRRVYEAGFFDPVMRAIDGVLPGGILLDAGCGEGSLLAALTQDGRAGIGFDIAKAAVQMAAGRFKGIAWCVADLCDIPLAEEAVDAIVNMLTPANYAEFGRVLKPEGILCKVVPNAGHLREIRGAAGKADYAHTLAETLTVFEKRFTLAAQQTVCYEVACGEALAGQVFAMTPLTAHMEAAGALPSLVTVDVTVLVGRAASQAPR